MSEPALILASRTRCNFNSMGPNERRRSRRHTAALDVTLHIGGGGRSLKGQSIDLSRSGIFVVMPGDVPAGARVDMLVDPGALGGALSLRGQVVHVVRGTGVGIRFGVLTRAAKERLSDLIAALKEQNERDEEITDETPMDEAMFATAMNSDGPRSTRRR
jgi:hypothetical protein